MQRVEKRMVFVMADPIEKLKGLVMTKWHRNSLVQLISEMVSRDRGVLLDEVEHRCMMLLEYDQE